MLNIENRTKVHSLTIMHKIINNIAPQYLSNRIKYRKDYHQHNTRKKNLIHMQNLNKSVKQNAFFMQASRDYNILVERNIIKKEMSTAVLKKRCKNFLLNIQNSNFAPHP